MTPNLDVLSDPARRLILVLIRRRYEACVCELVAALGDLQPVVSRHLAILREAGWLESRREGTWMHYRFVELPPWADDLVAALVAGGVPQLDQKRALNLLSRFSGGPVRVPLTRAK